MTLRVGSGTLRVGSGTLKGVGATRVGTRSTTSAHASATTDALSTGVVFPFARPSRSAMAAANKDVLAYYHTIPPWPEPDYTDWIDPVSNPNRGGRWRQRPYPVNTNTSPTQAQRLAYARADLELAADIGIDVFTINILTGYISAGDDRLDNLVKTYYQAANEFSQANTPGFKICPNISMLSVLGNNGNAVTWADAMSQLLVLPGQYKRGNRPVVCLYNVDNMPPQWYRDFHARLLNSYGINAMLIPSHQASDPTTLDTTAWKAMWTDGIFYGLHPWNATRYTVAPSSVHTAFRSFAATNGIPFMGTAGPQWENDRPDQDPTPKQTEGKGVTVIQNMWTRGITSNSGAGDPFFQIVSWSDHIESHNIRPSTGYQYVPYDITAYYLAWYKNGMANPPAITINAIYYMHRMHLSTAPYDTTKQDVAYGLGGALDQLITVTFVTPGVNVDVTVTAGGTTQTQSVAPGVQTQVWPFAANATYKFKMTRSGVTVVPEFSSAFPTRGPSVVYQDLLYRMGSSTRPALPAGIVQSSMPQDRM